jgi:hypothetical protein
LKKRGLSYNITKKNKLLPIKVAICGIERNNEDKHALCIEGRVHNSS